VDNLSPLDSYHYVGHSCGLVGTMGFPKRVRANSEPGARLIWMAPALDKPFLFWVLPIGGIAVAQMVCYSLDKTLLGQRWTVSDTWRLACWRTISPT
jgi:hypothetical protein